MEKFSYSLNPPRLGSQRILSVLAFLAGLACHVALFGQTNPNPNAKSDRFVRGEGDDPRFQCFVVPLDFQKGIALDPTGIDYSQFPGFTEMPWFFGTVDQIQDTLVSFSSRYQIGPDGSGIDYDNLSYRPIAAFGSAAGGTPLYVGKKYRFGFYAGGPVATTSYTDELRIRVFSKSDFENSNLFTIDGTREVKYFTEDRDNFITLPRIGTPEWEEFAENGFVLTHVSKASDDTEVLETTIEFLDASNLSTSGSLAVDAQAARWNVLISSPLVLTHRALAGGEDYFYRVDYAGLTAGEENGGDYSDQWMTVFDPDDVNNSGTYSLGYTMDFDLRPERQVRLIDTPHFTGEPVPPQYHGKTANELEFPNGRFEMDFGAPDSSFGDLGSTELLEHSELDRFVAEMGSDPMALANYVTNEILLADAIAYNEDGVHEDLEVNDGGMSRGAWATFQEGRGSPSEQCALLVYLLRKAGHKAAYVIPPANAVKMQTSNLSRMLEMQIQGMVDADGEVTIAAESAAIPVNYPWVAYYDEKAGDWHNIFPWIKDTRIVEGLNLYDYLPDGYDSPWQWVDKYLLKDPRIMDQIYQQPSAAEDGDGVVSLEAEGFFDNLSSGSDAWEFVEVDGASGAGAMQVGPDDGGVLTSGQESATNGARLDYYVNFKQAGEYHVWVRGEGADTNGNSVHLGLYDMDLDGSGSLVGSVIAEVLGDFSASGLNWQNSFSGGVPTANKITISSSDLGVKRLSLWMHEDGVIIDKIVLTKSTGAITDSGPAVSLFESGASTENPLANDTAGEVFKAFVETELRKNHPEIDLEDLGVDISRRKHYYSRWDDFPQPWEVDASLFGAYPENYLEDKFDDVPNKFDTLFFKVYKDDATTPILESTESIPALLFHNRRLLFRWVNQATDSDLLAVSMSPYDREVAGTYGDFSGSDYVAGHRWYTNGTTDPHFGASDDSLRVEITYNRHRSFTAGGYSTPEAWDSPFNYSFSKTISRAIDLTKGSTGALCIKMGQVSEKMLRTHVEEIWAAERDLPASASSITWQQLEQFQGITNHLMGMSYFRNVDRSANEIEALHKKNIDDFFGVGFARMEPLRDGNGDIAVDAGGELYPSQPMVDMQFAIVDVFASAGLRPDSGMVNDFAVRDYIAMWGAISSAHEHHIINDYWDQTESISTVKLLHLAGRGEMRKLSVTNYVAEGNVLYDGVALNQTDTSSWDAVESTLAETLTIGGNVVPNRFRDGALVYMTPGNVTGAKGDYTGVGTLTLSTSGTRALISGNKNIPTNGGAGNSTALNFDLVTKSGSAPAGSRYGLLDNHITFNNATVQVQRVSSDITTLFSSPISTSGHSSVVDNLLDRGISTSGGLVLNDNLGFNVLPVASQVYANTTFDWNGSNAGSLYDSTKEKGSALFVLPPLAYSGGFNGDTVYNSSFHSAFDSLGAIELVGDPVNVVTGEFYIDEVDLVLPGPFPLSIRRNYSSHAVGESEFGHGWKQAYFPYLLLSDDDEVIYAAEMDGSVIAYERETGTNTWRPTLEANPRLSNVRGGINNVLNARIELPAGATGAVNDVYTLTSADGSTRTFEVRTYPVGTSLTRERPYLKRWTDNRGNYHDFHFYDDDFYGSAGNASLRGSEYGLLRRIEASNGNFAGFRYDVQGHIKEIFTRDGRRLFYEYDQYGDLVSVERPDASVVRYDYQHKSQAIDDRGEHIYSEHLITRVTHPEGRILVNEYDSERRVVKQWATIGDGDANDPDAPASESNTPTKQAEYDYSGLTLNSQNNRLYGTVVVKDPYGRATTFTISGSQISQVVDQEEISNSQEWYADDDNSPGAYPRSLKRTVDRRGLVTEYFYDANGNTTETRVTGEIDGDTSNGSEVVSSTATYNALNLPVVTTDASGNQKVFAYEDTDYPYLPTRVEQRASDGTLISHSVTSYVSSGGANAPPFARGLVDYTVVGDNDTNASNNSRAHTDPSQDHARVEFEYNDEGWMTLSRTFTGTADPTVISQFDYNLRGELVEKRDLEGGATKRTTYYAYDDMGRRIWDEVLDESGVQVAWNYAYYNKNGELEWSDGPRYNPEDYVYRRYDGMGRPIEQVAWRSQAKTDGSGVEAVAGYGGYATTLTAYNLFGNAVKVTDPRGNTLRHYYDSAGRKIKTEAYQGNWENGGTLLSSESWAYEDGNQVSRHISPLNGETRFFYTQAGQPRRQENPDGTVLEWRYYTDGRVQREPESHATYWEVAYDDANRRVTRTLKNLAGTTLGVPVVTTVDRRGNVISSNDLAGHVSTTTYDDLNRVKSTSGPVATTGYSTTQSASIAYDAVGLQTVSTNGLGEQTVSEFDILGRPIATKVLDASGSNQSGDGFLVESSTTYSSDFHSVTTHSGTGDDQITSTVYTNNAGQAVLAIHGDGSLVTTVYDASGNPLSVTDEVDLTTTSTFDGLNRLSTTTLPGGAQTSFFYDGAGNLLERHLPGGAIEVRSYDAAGRVSGTSLKDDSQNVTRGHSYTYVTTGNNTGLLQEQTDGRGVVHSYDYDAFRRLTDYTATHPTDTNLSVSRVTAYDERSLPLTLTETTLGGSATTVIEQAFDEYGQLYDQRTLVDGVAVSHLSNTYDAAGRRVGLNKGSSIASLGGGSGSGSAIGFSYRADGLLSGVTQESTSSYDYANNGLLIERDNPWRTHTINSRDDRGRILTTGTTAGGTTVLSEAITWTADSRHNSYTATTSRLSGSNWAELRDYTYNDRRQLVSETYAPASGSSQTLVYQFDGGQTNGPGVRTSSSGAGMSVTVPSGGVDGFMRVVTEQSNNESASFAVTGTARGAEWVDLMLFGDQSLSRAHIDHAGSQDITGNWSASLDLSPGDYEMEVTATHLSDQTKSQTRNFSVTRSAAKTIDLDHFDGEGNATKRTVIGGNDQTLTWDALGRLIQVAQRDGNLDGIDWTARYDAFNRRVECTTTPVSNDVADVTRQFVERSWYDPLVEFLAIAVATKRGDDAWQRTWKVHGPDAVGGYGGLQGIGGVEATIDEATGETVGLVDDAYGHIIGYVEAGNQFSYARARYSGYGALPGSEAPSLYDGVHLSRVLGWRGVGVDATGFYCLGVRYYEPNSGRFLSVDPLGHGESMSLYCYAGGDPVNFVDPTGRGRGSGVVQVPVDYQPIVGSQAGSGWSQFGGLLGAGYKGTGQGIANGLNGMQDVAIDAINSSFNAFNPYAQAISGLNFLGVTDIQLYQLQKTDWSKGLISEETDFGHEFSKLSIGAGADFIVGTKGAGLFRGVSSKLASWTSKLKFGTHAPGTGARLVDGDITRFAQIRSQLGVGKKRNIAFGEGHVDGRDIGEVLGVSGRNTPGTLMPEDRIFKTIVDGHPRDLDAEVFVLENLARQLSPSSSGTVRLVSELPFCNSCSGVIKQFNEMFPNVNLILRSGQ